MTCRAVKTKESIFVPCLERKNQKNEVCSHFSTQQQHLIWRGSKKSEMGTKKEKKKIHLMSSDLKESLTDPPSVNFNLLSALSLFKHGLKLETQAAYHSCVASVWCQPNNQSPAGSVPRGENSSWGCYWLDPLV